MSSGHSLQPSVEHDQVTPAAEGDLPAHVAPDCCEESRPASDGVNHHSTCLPHRPYGPSCQAGTDLNYDIFHLD